MKKTVILLAVVLTAQVVLAQTLYSTRKLSDGTIIRNCRQENGKITFCTEQDMNNYWKFTNNPNKYITKELCNIPSYGGLATQFCGPSPAALAQKQRWAQEDAVMSKAFPIFDTIYATYAKLGKEYDNLNYKANLGVAVDARQLDLIQLQREVLDVLQNQSISVDMISITGIAGVKDRYLRLNEALKSGLINQQEYDKTKISIDKDYKVIENLYNKVMSLPIGTPRQHYATWIRANYSAISGVSKSSSGVSTGTNTLNKDKLREDLLKAAEERKLPSCKALYWKSAGFSSDYKRSIENTPKAYCTLKDGTPIPAQFKDVTSETGETIKLMKMLDFTGTTKYYPWD